MFGFLKMKKIKRRMPKKTSGMDKGLFEHLSVYIYNYQMDHNGELPPISEYSKTIQDYKIEHKIYPTIAEYL